MCEFSDDDAVELARNALSKNAYPKKNVLKATSDNFGDSNIRCEALIANNHGEAVSSENYFHDHNVRFNFYDGDKSLFEAHYENLHADYPHVHTGEERTPHPLNANIAASALASTTELILESYKKWCEEKKLSKPTKSSGTDI